MTQYIYRLTLYSARLGRFSAVPILLSIQNLVITLIFVIFILGSCGPKPWPVTNPEIERMLKSFIFERICLAAECSWWRIILKISFIENHPGGREHKKVLMNHVNKLMLMNLQNEGAIVLWYSWGYPRRDKTIWVYSIGPLAVHARLFQWFKMLQWGYQLCFSDVIDRSWSFSMVAFKLYSYGF